MNSKLSIVRELFQFVVVGNRWWIAPIVIALLAVAFTGVLLEGPAATQFIYTLF